MNAPLFTLAIQPRHLFGETIIKRAYQWGEDGQVFEADREPGCRMMKAEEVA